jgi:nifR3 family TIM-barrel protein
MVSAKGLYYGSENSKRLLEIADIETASAVQLFGSDGAVVREVVKRFINDTTFAFVDFNVGCPVRKVFNNGDGSALLLDLDRLCDVVRSLVTASEKPVSAKIRIGAEGKIVAVDAAKRLEDAGVGMIAVHGRTREQMYSGSADWDEIAKVVEAVQIPVVANGDVINAERYQKIKAHTDCHGVMIGRAAMGNPFIFEEISAFREGILYEKPGLTKIILTARRHLGYLCELKPEKVAISEFRSHFAWYLKGVRGSASFRNEVNHVTSLEGMSMLFDKVLEQLYG